MADDAQQLPGTGSTVTGKNKSTRTSSAPKTYNHHHSYHQMHQMQNIQYQIPSACQNYHCNQPNHQYFLPQQPYYQHNNHQQHYNNSKEFYRQRNYQTDQMPQKQFEPHQNNGCYDESHSSQQESNILQTPSTSSMSGAHLQSHSMHSNNSEQIQLQPLHITPDSPSLVKVKSWYTMSKRDVC